MLLCISNLKKILAPNDSMIAPIHGVSFIPTRGRSLFLSKPARGDLMQIPACSSRIPEGLLLFPCRSRVAARVRDAAPRAANGAARRTAGELAYEVGIERGIPDVSIAREMDTPFHRVLLSGLVYARARLTIGPCFNRRSGSQPASRFTSSRVGVLRGYY